MVIAIGLSLGCAAFLSLAVIILLKTPRGAVAWRMFVVCCGTAAWAALAAAQPWWMPGFADVAEGVRDWLWLDLLVLVLAGSQPSNAHPHALRLLIAVTTAAMVVIDLRYAPATASPVDFFVIQCYMRIAVAIGGLLLVENIYRNGAVGQRWNVAPLCLAAGALFGFDFYVFGDAIVQHSVDAALLATRGIVLLLIAPLVFLTMVRNQDWRIYVHVSRGIVFHTATLIIGGLFLLGAGAVGSLFGSLGAPWGDVFRLAFTIAVVLTLAVALSVGRFRSQIWRFVNENFFSSRYDYRLEWMRFVETVSASDNASLQGRVILALANVVDSPAGALWLEDFDGVFRVANSLNMSLGPSANEKREGSFLAAFDGGKKIQQFSSASGVGGTEGGPAWVLPDYPIWLAVPLVLRDHITGFVVLAPPRAEQSLNWESFDLLRILGHQIAGYLAEQKSLSSLAEARALIEYSKNFSFITHDIKNVAGQLSMLAVNAAKFGQDPCFHADMIQTLQYAGTKLKSLLEAPKPSATFAVEAIDPVPVIKATAESLSRNGRVVKLDLESGNVRVRIAPSQLDSALAHLITNALEASQFEDPVSVRMRVEGGVISIAVEDCGEGMDETFIRERLFTPRYSTKPCGHGIGAYQAREIVRGAGGNLNVTSVPGNGSIVQIVLPMVDAAPHREPGLAT